MNQPIPSLVAVMSELSLQRNLFHSEADFQHAFAWDLHKRLPDANVTLERPYRTDSSTLHLDMLVTSDGLALAVELKYKTVTLVHLTQEHDFHLLNQGAQDLGRYDYLKDIWRLEKITKSVPRCKGWAVLLTNDGNYWTQSKRSDTVDSDFRLAEGSTMSGVRAWGDKASAGTKKNREASISLENSYILHWRDYSDLAAKPNGMFRYLSVEVGNEG